MNKNTILNLIGYLFLIWGLAAIIDNIFKANTGIAPVLWMSYICLIVLSIGILKKDSSLVASQVAIIGIPYILWNIDFFYQLLTKSSLFGLTDYFFTKGKIIGKIISIQHIFNLPLSIYSIYLIKLKRKDFWKISLFQISIVFLISRIATNYNQNVNCVYRNCANFSFGLPHILEWFLANMIMISVTSYILIKTLKNKK